MNFIDYNCDVFFKYAFGRNTHDSQILRAFLLEYLIPISLDDYGVDNPELIPQNIKDKTVILDIYMRKSHVEINMEMQKSHLSRYLHRRFIHYSSKLVASQLEPGETAHQLKDVIQILFVEDIDRRHPCLIDSYHAKQHHGHLEQPYYVQTTIYVYLPYIEVICQEKEELNEFEALIYLMHTNHLSGIYYKEEKGVIQIMERLHRNFTQDHALMEATMVRYQQRENFQLWHDMDVEDAKETGKIDFAKELIMEKYRKDPSQWLSACTSQQINQIKSFILMDLSYDEFVKAIQTQDQALMEATMARYQQRENFQLWHDMDVEDAKEEGKKEGKETGKMNFAKELIMEKYKEDPSQWLCTCTPQQINQIKSFILMDLSYDEFVKAIQNQH